MLPGTVLGEAKAALFSRADVFAQPSLHENFGASVAEALCYGIPCVVSNGVALAPDVAEAGAGLVCDSEAGSLADSLKRLMGDPDLRSQCGRKALELSRRYQPENVAAQLDHEYELCITDRAREQSLRERHSFGRVAAVRRHENFETHGLLTLNLCAA